jgi:hypothetical protein
MKNMGTIIGICFTILMIVIVGALTYQSMFSRSKAANPKAGYQVPAILDKTTKPETGLNKAIDSVGSAPASEASSAQELLQELNSTSDDDGASELQDLQQEAGQL